MKRRRTLWHPDEDAILRRDYRTPGGPARCAAQLDNRTLNGIRMRAGVLGLAEARSEGWPSSPQIDEVIARAYRGPRKVGFVEVCARAVGRPRKWVSLRAGKLGLTVPTQTPRWTAEERAFANANPGIRADTLSHKMRQRGWNRSVAAINAMRRDERIARANREAGIPDGMHTSIDIAAMLGLGRSAVQGWVSSGSLAATTASARGIAGLPGSSLLIHERDLAAFIIANPLKISLAKLEPNKVWFLDLMARYASAPTRQDGNLRNRVRSLLEVYPELEPAEVARRTEASSNLVAAVGREIRRERREIAHAA